MLTRKNGKLANLAELVVGAYGFGAPVIEAIVEQPDDVDAEARRKSGYMNGFLGRGTAADDGDALTETAGAIERHDP